MKFFILILTTMLLLNAQEIRVSERSALIKDYRDDGKICDHPHRALPSRQGFLVLVDSSYNPYSAWTQRHECLAYNPTDSNLQFVNRGFVHSGVLNVHQISASSFIHDYTVYDATIGNARYPTSVASDGPHISFPVLDTTTGTWGHMCGQYERGGWFSSFWESAVDFTGDIEARNSIGKQLPTGDIVFITDFDDGTLRYETWTADLMTQQAVGVFGTGDHYYWGSDATDNIYYLFYIDAGSGELFYRTTIDGINWSTEAQWNIIYPTPYTNNVIDFTQMALTEASTPVLVFDIADDDDPHYPQAHKVYVQVGDGATPVKVSEDTYTASWYPTVATGYNDYIIVLFHVWTNGEYDSLARNDVFLVYSPDNGVSWSLPFNFTDEFPYRPGLAQLAKRFDEPWFGHFFFFGINMIVDLDIFWAILAGNQHRLDYTAWYISIPWYGIEENAQNLTPQKLYLDVYPNPFRQKTQIRYEIPAEVDSPDTEVGMLDLSTKSEFRKNRHSEKIVVSIKIYDATGRLVRQYNQLTNHQSLINQITWQGDDDFGRKLPAGVYFVRLEDSETSIVEKAIKCE